MFHKKYHTWFRRTEPGEQLPRVIFFANNILQGQQARYIYFDYETNWQQKASTDNDIDESQFENELVPEPPLTVGSSGRQ